MSDEPPQDRHALLPARLRDALHAAGTSVWEWDIVSDALYGEAASSAWLGYSRAEEITTQEQWNALIHPDDRAAQDVAYERHLRGLAADYESEYRARAKDGSWVWMSERGRIVERAPDGRPLRMIGTITDIRRRRAAEAQAEESTQRLRRIARHAPGVLFQFERAPDGSARFPYVSESCIDVLQLAPEVLTKDATAFIRSVLDSDRDRVLESIAESARLLRPWRCEFRLFRRGAAPAWLAGAATPQRMVHEGVETVLWHGYIEDVTERHELEDMRRAAAAAEAASQAKTAFLSRISHELRTPLNAVLGFAQLLELDADEPLRATQAKRVARIREAGAHLLEMIGELLDLSRIEAGQMALAIGEVWIAPLIRECVAMLGPHAQAARVEVATPEGLELAVRADPTRLRQVLLNLIGNAIKYNRPGGSVRIVTEAGAGQVTLSVIDTGIGIPGSDLPQLFEPFQRGAQHGGPIEGSGIGLAVTRALVQQMGGRVEVESRYGEGSVFRVTLPAA
jgi:hypothetical protein